MAKAKPISGVLPTAPLRINAPLALSTRLDEMLACAGRIQGPEDVKPLHELRIAVKRLRYTLEIFEEAVDGADDFLAVLKRLQDALGEIHDADVLGPLLEGGKGRPEAAGVRALAARTREDRDHLYAEFTHAWAAERDGQFAERLRAAALAGAMPGEQAPDPTASVETLDLMALLNAARHAIGGADPRDLRTLVKSLQALQDAKDEEDAARRTNQRALRRLKRFLEGTTE